VGSAGLVLSEILNVVFRACSGARHAILTATHHHGLIEFCERRMTMKEWLKPEITESEAGMEVTSYLPAELDRA
jgi:coenzyme PQQ precursor peptide PqqA